MTSILPAHLSELERDLEQAVARVADVEIPISTLWDPWQCPLEVLPYLAWALSVDQWRSNWSETVKRRVVAASLPLHRIKGTRPAVEQALEALGVVADLTEWFEADPPREPGTFDLIAWANENLTPDVVGFLNDELYDQIATAVTNAKNARSHFTFRVGAKFGPNTVGLASGVSGLGALARRTTDAVQAPLEGFAVGVGAGATSRAASLARFTSDIEQAPLETSEAGMGVAATATGVAVARFGGAASIDARIESTRLGVAGACRGWAVIYRQMEATT